MVFELAGHTALDCPMSGIVDSRRHFIGDQSIVDDEKLDGEHTDVGERVHHPFQIDSRTALESRICKRRDAVVQDAAAVTIGRERIEHGLTRRGAGADDGYFAREFLKFLVDQARAADRSPSRIDVRGSAYDDLAFAVITQAPCLEYAGKPHFAGRADQLLFAVD